MEWYISCAIIGLYLVGIGAAWSYSLNTTRHSIISDDAIFALLFSFFWPIGALLVAGAAFVDYIFEEWL